MKKTITVLLTISSIAFTILAMMCLSIIEPSLYCKKNNNRVYLNLIFCYCFFFFSVLYATVIIGACANYAASPLFMELAVEMAFPVDETVVGGFMSCTYNLIGALFLFAFFIPDIGILINLKNYHTLIQLFLSYFVQV
jgi:FLVCR family MFS transporter